MDEWKLYQNDGDISDIDTDQRVDHYWNAVFLLTSVEGNGHYQLLPCLVKSCLVLAHANADSERSLSVNARVVTKERSRFGEQTIVGLRLLKDAVKDPRPSKLQTSEDPCHQRNEEICTFGTLGVQGKIRPRKGREEGVRSGNYEKERGRRKTEEREGEVVEV